MRTLVVTGPLGDDEVAAIVFIVRAAEMTKPDEHFQVLVDDDDAEELAAATTERFHRMAGEVPEGYQRILEIVTKDDGVPT